MLGAVKTTPGCGLQYDDYSSPVCEGYFMATDNGGIWGNGKYGSDKHELVPGPTPSLAEGKFMMGDRVGCLVDLDAGWLRYYRNGARCGPGFTEGVTGPLLRCVQMFTGGKRGETVTALPGAEAPMDIDAVAVPRQDYSRHSPEQLQVACKEKGLEVGGIVDPTGHILQPLLEAAEAEAEQQQYLSMAGRS